MIAPMGIEIESTNFSKADFQNFSARLKEETELLKSWWKNGQLAVEPPRMGFELEAWLVAADAQPSPCNAEVLARRNDPMLSPELAQYNLEFNSPSRELGGSPFSAMQQQLQENWRVTGAAAAEFGARLAMIGILPTLQPEHLTLERMSRLHRYQALNEQVLLLRNRRPLSLDIEGEEALHLEHDDVMLEAAATSLQLHLQVTPQDAPRFYNASVLASAATVAVAANSPYLFGRRLWEETRIPLFEQAVAVAPLHGGHSGPYARVSFGSGYGRDALYGFFVENRQHYPVLLPVLLNEPVEKLAHLRLHNGTIWRWNRPLVGFDDAGRPHLRVEHRVMAAGPTVVDSVANAAFYYGLAFALAAGEQGSDARLPFPLAERNFYAAAREGLAAEVDWFGASRVNLRKLVLESLLPQARAGLISAGVHSDEADQWLKIVEARADTARTGAAWQRTYVARHGRDFVGLLEAYLANQERGEPVHRWDV
jgi:hypothetical protein